MQVFQVSFFNDFVVMRVFISLDSKKGNDLFRLNLADSYPSVLVSLVAARILVSWQKVSHQTKNVLSFQGLS